MRVAPPFCVAGEERRLGKAMPGGMVGDTRSQPMSSKVSRVSSPSFSKRTSTSVNRSGAKLACRQVK
jgi:hypothetical protein